MKCKDDHTGFLFTKKSFLVGEGWKILSMMLHSLGTKNLFIFLYFISAGLLRELHLHKSSCEFMILSIISSEFSEQRLKYFLDSLLWVIDTVSIDILTKTFVWSWWLWFQTDRSLIWVNTIDFEYDLWCEIIFRERMPSFRKDSSYPWS